MRLIGAAALLLLLAGCSSPPTIDAAGWAPPQADVTEVECGELLDEWGTGEQDAPDACWTVEESTGLEDRFSALVSDFSDHAGAEPTGAPECMGRSDVGASAVSCRAEWEGASGVVTLSTGLTLNGLIAEMDSGAEVDSSTPRLYEITVWTTDEPFPEQQTFDDLYEPLSD